MSSESILKKHFSQEEEIIFKLKSQMIENKKLKDDEESNIYEKYEKMGSDIVKLMTNLSICEFKELYEMVKHALKEKRRGPKSKFSPIDRFFLLLVMLKYYEKWDEFASTFGYKTSAVEKVAMDTLERVYNPLIDHLIIPLSKDKQIELGINFPNFKEALIVGDTIFQPCQKPSLRDQYYYFNAKHCLYGIKKTTFNIADGRAVLLLPFRPGSEHDMTTLTKESNMIKLKKLLLKNPEETHIPDEGEGAQQFNKMWAVLLDKAYYGIDELIRAIIPIKGISLSKEQQNRNKLINQDGIIIKNFYGRLKSYWAIMRDTWRWDLKVYDKVFGICAAITNFLITKHPLRNEDGLFMQSLFIKIQRRTIKKRKKKTSSGKISKKKKRKRK